MHRTKQKLAKLWNMQNIPVLFMHIFFCIKLTARKYLINVAAHGRDAHRIMLKNHSFVKFQLNLSEMAKWFLGYQVNFMQKFDSQLIVQI